MHFKIKTDAQVEKHQNFENKQQEFAAKMLQELGNMKLSPAPQEELEDDSPKSVVELQAEKPNQLTQSAKPAFSFDIDDLEQEQEEIRIDTQMATP